MRGLDLLAAAALAFPAAAAPAAEFDGAAAARFARLALDCAEREYPNKIAHVLNGDGDAKPPRELTPCFYGCYDWHSAVHGHWLLVRLVRLFPAAEFATEARRVLAQNITAEHAAAEAAYLARGGNESFERPYGLAWLLTLARELREWDDPLGRDLAMALEPLERAAVGRLTDWLPKLSHPIRTGEHSQTAFALGLVLDYARGTGSEALAALVEARARAFHLGDRGCSLSFEPGGQDFLSPCIAEADLMRRVLAPVEFGAWLEAFLPELPRGGGADWIAPAVVTDKTDGKLAHLDGLNLSRAWMLRGVAAGLPEDDARIAALRGAADRLAAAGLAAVTGEHYEGGHWLGSFAVYLVSQRGLR